MSTLAHDFEVTSPDIHQYLFSREACLSRGCTWCRGDMGTAWCFEDPSVNMGGETCDTDIPDSERISRFINNVVAAPCLIIYILDQSLLTMFI